ncbi:MAG: UMP kinase [Bacteroidales bacterium]|nr:UMP kinase [Bacteroidales bacterium]
MKYKRILLKLSGESLAGSQDYGIQTEQLMSYAKQIEEVVKTGVQVAVVIGGGNIFRGLKGQGQGFDRVQGDYMGMLATVINSLALQSALDNLGIKSEVLSGLAIEPVCKRMSRKQAVGHLDEGKVVIIGGGTGNPFFTTDSAAALRAVEIKADAILKGTRVDGVYTADPEKFPDAVKYDRLSFEQAYEQKLNIMDLTAFTLCQENNIPIIVFDVNKNGNLLKVVNGEPCGTIVC